MPMQPIGGPLNLDTSIGQPLQMPAPQAQKPRGGMFAGADWGSALQALIGGALASKGNPGGQFLLNMLNQKRQQALQSQQHQQGREDDFQDYIRKESWDIANKPKAPHVNDTVADYDFIANQLGPDAAKEYLRNKTLAPPMMVPGPNGQMFMVPRVMPQQQSGPQPGQVEDGFQFIGGDPADKNNWKPAGGPTPQASGGFPRPY